MKKFIQKHSENIAGAVGFAGSMTVLINSFEVDKSKLDSVATVFESVTYNGDPTNLVAAAAFTAGNIILLRKGHTSAGYSAGMGAFGLGDLALVFSEAAQGESYLRLSLVAMAVSMGIGAAKYPLEKLSGVLSGKFKNAAKKMAEYAPKVSGTGSLALRLPGVAAAVEAGNMPLMFAFACWGTADILAGRLQETVGQGYQFLKKRLNKSGSSPSYKI